MGKWYNTQVMDMSGEMLVGCVAEESHMRYSAAYHTGERAWGGRTFCHGVTPWSRGDWSVRGSGTGVRELQGLECTSLSDWSVRASRTGVRELRGLECVWIVRPWGPHGKRQLHHSELHQRGQTLRIPHSPLVMASLEDVFDAHTDKWLDFDFSGECREVRCEERPLERLGGAEDWLRSVAFDLTSTRSKGMEQMLNAAADQLQHMLEKCDEQIKKEDQLSGKSQKRELRKTYLKLVQNLSPTDSFLVRFRMLCESRGWNLR